MEEEEQYSRDDILLLVEKIKDSMVITKHDLGLEEAWALIVFLVDKVSEASGLDYNSVLDDLKEKE